MKRNHLSANPGLPLDRAHARQDQDRAARQPIYRSWSLSLLLLVFCPSCKQAASTDTPAAASSASAPAPAASVGAPEAKSAAAPQTGSACAGKYQGEYTVAVAKPELTKKEGAPEQWEKDDGKTLAGKGTLTLQVDSANVVSGSAEGALGQQALRGACDENTLRVQLDSAGDDPTQIRNAYLIADLAGPDASGTLTAATGDSLIRRTGPVTLHRVP